METCRKSYPDVGKQQFDSCTRYGSGLGLQPLSCCSKGGHLGEYAGWISRIHYHKDNSEQCQRQRLLCFNGNSKSGGNGSIYIYPSIPAGAQNQNKAKVGTIKFRTNGDGDIFDVIRNHSYLFNIKLSTIEIDAELQYQVMDWTEVDNGELDFGDGDVRK